MELLDHSFTPLMVASAQGDLERVEALIAAGANVTEKLQTGHTALMGAVEHGHVAVVKYLIAVGANVRVTMLPSFSKTRMFEMALSGGNPEIVVALIQAGVDPNGLVAARMSSLEVTPLRDAIENSDFNMAVTLIEAGADVNALTVKPNRMVSLQKMPLELAIERYALLRAPEIISMGFAVVAMLIERGADLNYCDRSSGLTPLMLAIQLNQQDIVKLLLDNGADVNAYNNVGITPLLHFVTNKIIRSQQDETILRSLLEAGATLDAKDWRIFRKNFKKRQIRRCDKTMSILREYTINSLLGANSETYIDWLVDRPFNYNTPLYGVLSQTLQAQLTPTVTTPDSYLSWLQIDTLLQLHHNTYFDRGSSLKKK